MLTLHPGLAIVLLIHLKKTQGRRGGRELSDVLGEWGRWSDVVLLMEAKGRERVLLNLRKRVRHEQRIVVTKTAGLLVDPCDPTEVKATKVPPDRVMDVIRDTPGITYAELGERLGVSSDTASRYVRDLGDKVCHRGWNGF